MHRCKGPDAKQPVTSTCLQLPGRWALSETGNSPPQDLTLVLQGRRHHASEAGVGVSWLQNSAAAQRAAYVHLCVFLPQERRASAESHAVGLLLALLNNIARADAEVRRGLWRREENRGYELGNLTVGIIGYGNMGHAFAQRLSGFGCRVVAYDKYKAPEGIEAVSLEELQGVADVVSFHVPLTGETRHYLDAGFIASMRKPFFLLNTSRGAVVDTAALAQGLEEGKVRGAALDVLEYEDMTKDGLADAPEPMQYLLRSDRTVLTPHVAGWTVESKYKLAAVLADKIIDVLK